MDSSRNVTINVAPKASQANHGARIDVAVNGTLMRGLELEPNLLNLGGTFIREDRTEKAYRLFSIDDVHPGMVRVPAVGFEEALPVSVEVEIWCVPLSGITTLLMSEPPGLSIGKVRLQDGRMEVLGVIAEPALVAGKKDISDYPGGGRASFRDYIAREGMRIIDETLMKRPRITDEQLAAVRRYSNVGELLYKNGQLRGAVDVLNHAVKMLGLKDRIFLNIPLGYAEIHHRSESVLS